MADTDKNKLDRFVRQVLRGMTVGIVVFFGFVFGVQTELLSALVPGDHAEIGFFITWLAAGLTLIGCMLVDIPNPAAYAAKKEDRPTPSLVWCAGVNSAILVVTMVLPGIR